MKNTFRHHHLHRPVRLLPLLSLPHPSLQTGNYFSLSHPPPPMVRIVLARKLAPQTTKGERGERVFSIPPLLVSSGITEACQKEVSKLILPLVPPLTCTLPTPRRRFEAPWIWILAFRVGNDCRPQTKVYFGSLNVQQPCTTGGYLNSKGFLLTSLPPFRISLNRFAFHFPT